MTTLTSAGGPSEVINARRTESLDAPAILNLVQPSTEQLFGRVNVVNVIEKAVLAVTLSNDQDEVLGHAAFFDYPNVPSVDQANWEEWLNKYYDVKKVSALNTLFMHFFVAKPEYSHGCGQEIVRTVFNAVPELQYCFLVAPTGVFPDSALSDLFNPAERIDGSKGPEKCVVFQCNRYEHVPVLHVRNARVQDHDDLVPIFNRQSDILRNTYGDYFLAELIEAQDDEMKCVAAEVAGVAVGFMSVGSDVNLDLLNECFHLEPFHGLREPHEEDEIIAPGTPTPELSAEQSEERPLSATSERSESSRISKVSSAGSKIGSVAKSASGSTRRSQQVTSPQMSRSNSVVGEEPKVKGKLADAAMVDSAATLLSDHSDAESVKSEANDREILVKESFASAPMEPVTPAKPLTPEPKVSKRFVPTYKGKGLAIAVQLFCIDENFEMRSIDFLPKVFELFPNHEYCLVTVPHLVPEFPLLQQFVRVTPRCPSTLSQELYVFHRSGLLKDFTVRQACPDHLPGIEKLVKTLNLHENLLADLNQFFRTRRDDDGTEIQAYVAESCAQIVGIAILRREEDIEYIRSHYNIEDFIYFNHHNRVEHGHLHHFALNPVFKHYTKQFLKELLRHGHKTCLYYPLYPSYADKQILAKHTLVAALQEMVPVRARRQIQYPVDKLGGNAPSARVLQEQPLYALNHINRKLTLEPKVTINARIVVIGASDVGLGFLETFAFCPHLRFNNLSLISPHGLPGELAPDQIRDQMLISSMCYTNDEYAQMSLRSWVNCVYGKMTGIDRKKKLVIVNNNTIVPYDHLIITAGQQYQIPNPTGANISNLATNHEIPNKPDKIYAGVPPKNVFAINDQYDAAVALYWLENNFVNTNSNAIIYGSAMDIYTQIGALLSLGVSGKRIVVVEPPNTDEVTIFNNPVVDNLVTKALEEAGVIVHKGCILAEWNDGADCEGGIVTSAGFTTNAKPMRLECGVFFSCYKKMVDPSAFKAINNSCLVFDGRLVIDANFHTNDVSIRGAGPLTKFQRSYHADQWSHANFNSKEVGIQLASAMLSLFDPTLEPEPEPPKDLLKLIPMYRSPKIVSGYLPGNYYYLNVGKPSLKVPLEVLMGQNEYGRELVTGSVEDGNLFRLHINQYNSIETITCLSKTPIRTSNIICLYGLHERMLNNLVSRFEEGLITDFHEYFNETWALAIFHDRFPDFRDEVRELLITRPNADVEALEEKVRKLIEEDLVLSKDQRKSLLVDYEQGGFKRAVETRLLSFLSYNYYHMSMYAKPGMV